MENTVHQSIKNAYVIITDLHDTYVKKQNRYSYKDELFIVKQELFRVIEKYKVLGYNVYLIFLGDIFDRGYLKTFDAVESNNEFICLRNNCSGIYSVIGNHELSFYSDNPFYTLVTEIESKKVRNINNKTWAPRGTLPVIRVPDVLEDGEVIFHFNHYATPINPPLSERVNIGLFHQDIVCNEILEQMEQQLGEHKIWGATPIDLDKVSVFRGYRYSFLGHLHKVYGQWNWEDDETGDKSYLYYLASLGRPNCTEVNDAMLERNFPVVCIENGRFSAVEDNTFMLPNLASSVKKEVVEMEHMRYEAQKARKEYRKYKPTEDEPIQNVLMRCRNDNQRNICEELIKASLTTTEIQIAHQIQKYVGGRN